MAKKANIVDTSSSLLDLKQLIETSLDDGKAQDIVTIDLRGKTDIADYMIIASGTSDRHTSSLAENIITKIRTSSKHRTFIQAEGLKDGSWVLVDTGNIIVHIFKPEIRELYNLEEMWSAPMFNHELAHS